MSTSLALVRPHLHQYPLRRRPSSGRRQPRPDEVAFYKFARRLFPSTRYEPETLETARGNNGQLIEAISPDLFVPEVNVFLELTQCDKFLEAADLPEEIQHKNTASSQSHLPHISPAEYLARKQAKINRAEYVHGVHIILLQGALQDEILGRSELLAELISAKLGPSRPLLRLA